MMAGKFAMSMSVGVNAATADGGPRLLEGMNRQ